MKQKAYNSSFIISDSTKGPSLSLDGREGFFLFLIEIPLSISLSQAAFSIPRLNL